MNLRSVESAQATEQPRVNDGKSWRSDFNGTKSTWTAPAAHSAWRAVVEHAQGVLQRNQTPPELNESGRAKVSQGPWKAFYFFIIDETATFRTRELTLSLYEGAWGEGLERRVLKPSALSHRHLAELKKHPQIDALSAFFSLRQMEKDAGFDRMFEQREIFGSGNNGVRVHVSFRYQSDLLRRLCATGCLGWLGGPRQGGNEFKPVRWDFESTWNFHIVCEPVVGSNGYFVRGELRRDTERKQLQDLKLLFRVGAFVTQDAVHSWVALESFPWLSALHAKPLPVLSENDARSFVDVLMSQELSLQLDVPDAWRWPVERRNPTPVLSIVPRKPSEGTLALQAVVQFDYGFTRMVPWTTEGLPPRLVDIESRVWVLRDVEREALLLTQLSEVIRKEDFQDGGESRFVLPDDFVSVARHFMALGWQVELEGRKVRAATQFDIKVISGIDWFELETNLGFEGFNVSVPQILKAAHSQSGWIALSDGSVGVVAQKWLDQFSQIAEFGQNSKNRIRLSRSQAPLLASLECEDAQWSVDDEFASIRSRLRSFTGVQDLNPSPRVLGTLRDYQKRGLGWLDFLRTFQFGGCLADDMGLGKTLQVLALLDHVHANEQGVPPPPSLVVVPRSLVDNWIAEARRFTPHLRCVAYAGAERDVRSLRHGVDVIVMTYNILRLDVETLKTLEFCYVILDEAQYIKNRTTDAAAAARSLKARHRLALTGTPVENHVSDIHSIFEFLNPGFFGYGMGASRGLAAGRKNRSSELISRAIKPLLLRRTKEAVLKELPSKTEQILYCELNAREKTHYNDLRRYYQASLKSRIEEYGLEKSRFQVLEGLLRLRQAACHVGLIDERRREGHSAKTLLLVEQLSEIVESGHKALVFSQFTTFLGIVKTRLQEAGLNFEFLDGKTRDRLSRVHRFQTDPSCGVFLISLKAGGVGLNLTAADYCFILDPWWNPAAEAQAVDRAHRIGQTRPVFAYKMIAKGTVEEKILALQNQKKDLYAQILGDSLGSESEWRLTAEDVDVLFS